MVKFDFRLFRLVQLADTLSRYFRSSRGRSSLLDDHEIWLTAPSWTGVAADHSQSSFDTVDVSFIQKILFNRFDMSMTRLNAFVLGRVHKISSFFFRLKSNKFSCLALIQSRHFT